MRVLILSLLFFIASPLCTEISRNLRNLYVDNYFGMAETFEVNCQNNDLFYFPDAEFARINAPIVLYSFEDSVPQIIDIPNYQPFFSCFNDNEGGCSSTCPNGSPGQCLDDSSGPNSFCYGYYLASNLKYFAYSLLFVDVLTVTTFKSSFYDGKTPASSVFGQSPNSTVRFPMIFDNDNAVLVGFESIATNENATDYYYFPELNLLIKKDKLAKLKIQEPTVTIGNQPGFDCKTQIPQVNLDTDNFKLKEWAVAPFNWIVVTQPATSSYTVQDFVTTKLRFFTANGLKSASMEQTDIVWDPCHQDHFSLKIKDQVGIFDFEIGVDSTWDYETVCIILQEVGVTKYSLAQFNVQKRIFEPSNKWTGLLSDNIIDNYNVIFTRSPPPNIVLTPQFSTIPTFEFSSEGTKPTVTMSTNRDVGCKLRFSHNCQRNLWGTATEDLTDCLPLHPFTYYMCEINSGIIVNPDYLVSKPNVDVPSEGQVFEEPAEIPPLQAVDNSGSKEIERRSLGEYFTDFSSAGNIYRGILVLSSAITMILVFCLSRFIMKKIHNRKKIDKVGSQVVKWREV